MACAAGAFSGPMRLMPDSVFAGVVKGRVLLRLLDQIELLNGVVDHRPLVLPRIDCDKTEDTRVRWAGGGRGEGVLRR